MADPIKAVFKVKEATSFSSPERQSPGILDDFAVRKDLTTQSLQAGTSNSAPALYVDSVNNRVGIGTKTPNKALEVVEPLSTTAAIRVLRGATSNIMEIYPPRGSVAMTQFGVGTTGAIVLTFAMVNVASGAAGVGDFWMGSLIGNATPNFVFDTSANSLLLQTTAANSVAVATALLELSSTSKGFLPPRMTTTQKNNISSPATGLMVYDTTLNKVCVYTGSAWETMTSV